jgi:hypothetical protein
MIKEATNQKLQRHLSLLRRQLRLAEVILIIYGLYPSVISPEIMKTFKDFLLKECENRGAAELVKFIKINRNIIMRFVLENPILQSPDAKVNKDGWPTRLTFLQPLASSTDGLKALLTLLMLTRSVRLPSAPKLDSIVDPWEGSDSITEYELSKSLRLLRVYGGRVGNWTFPHTSTKRGPQGQALLSSLSELTDFPQELLSCIKEIGGEALSRMIEANTEGLDILEAVKPRGFQGIFSVSAWWNRLFPTKSKSLRKLSYFPDKEGKDRIIAIVDYWSQSALKPIHHHLNMILKRIPTDCTFDQNSFTRSLPSILPDGNSFHSIDLSAATDRMPIALQKRVISHVYGSSAKADAWATILVGLPFNFRKPDKSVIQVKYAAGQPMGAYSSWPSMALTHHVIVQVAAIRAFKKLGVNLKSLFLDYSLLGDDLMIRHDLVSAEYKSLIKELHMPYSEAKTHTSLLGGEFAKRWFYKGTEITGFSIHGLSSVWKSYPQLLNFMQNQGSHGWILPMERHPDLILAVHKVIHGDKFIFEKTNRMIKLYLLFNAVKESLISRDWTSVISIMESQFGLTLSDLGNLSFPISHIFNQMYLLSKRNLVEKDLLTFQKQAYKINARLWGFVNERVKEARVDQATADFLKETTSVVLNWDNPVVLCLNRLIDQSTDFLMKYWDPDMDSQWLFQEGLSKYSISKGVFSMRNSTSIMLAESAILKEFISTYRLQSTNKLDISLLELEKSFSITERNNKP